MTCPITGDATITTDDAEPDGMRWERADPEIHVAAEVLDPTSEYAMDEHGRAFVLATYDIGEHCPYHPRTRHARRKDLPCQQTPGGTAPPTANSATSSSPATKPTAEAGHAHSDAANQ